MRNIFNFISCYFLLFDRNLFNFIACSFLNCFARVLFNFIASSLVNFIARVFLNTLINLIFTIRIYLKIFLFPIPTCPYGVRPALSTEFSQHLQNLQFSISDTLQIFLIIYDSYQCFPFCLGLWCVFLLSQICILPQYLSSYWCPYPVLCTHVNVFNERSVYCIYTY